VASANAWTPLRRLAGDCGVKVHDLVLLKGDLRVTRVVMNLHRFHVRRRDFAVRALVFRVPTFLHPRPVSQARLAAAAVGSGGVDLCRDLLGRVLLGLRLPCHRVEMRLSPSEDQRMILFLLSLTVWILRWKRVIWNRGR